MRTHAVACLLRTSSCGGHAIAGDIPKTAVAVTVTRPDAIHAVAVIKRKPSEAVAVTKLRDIQAVDVAKPFKPSPSASSSPPVQLHHCQQPRRHGNRTLA